MANRTKVLVVCLVIVIVVLAGVMTYLFFIKPKVTGFTTNLRNEGIVFTVNAMVAQIQQQGFAQIPVDNQGHYVLLVLAPDQPGLPPQPAPETQVQ